MRTAKRFVLQCLPLLILCMLLHTNAFAQPPAISYLIPDIGSPNSTTAIEIIAPYSVKGSFGSDGTRLNNPGDALQVVCANTADTNKLKFGPLIVSWTGRVISTQVFIASCPVPNSSDWRELRKEFRIPIKVIHQGLSSNVDTFYMVKPQLGIFGRVSGALGSGGALGIRSRRGAMIVDSLDLATGNFTVSIGDCDPWTPGNQGYLPAVIISRGTVRIASTAILDVSAIGINGGPGGGGGGLGDGPSNAVGGAGFSGGGPGETGNCSTVGGMGSGGIGSTSGGGTSLNNLPPSPPNMMCCQSPGGSGHPFVILGSGRFATATHEGDGASAGYGRSGSDGLGQRGSAPIQGGVEYGNPMIVPLAGGSGGTGGNEFCSCAPIGSNGVIGGGGGGALALHAYQFLSSGLVQSRGAIGTSGGAGCVGHASIGGSGSGGGVLISARTLSTLGSVNANGAQNSHSDAGSSGAGRIRLDLPLSLGGPVGAGTVLFGLSMTPDTFVSQTFTISGFGTSGGQIHCYMRSAYSPWQLIASPVVGSNTVWTANVTLPNAAGKYYVVAHEVSPANPTADSNNLQPFEFNSQAAAQVLYSRGTTFLDPDVVNIRQASFPLTPVCDSSQSDAIISIDCYPLTISSVALVEDTAKVFSVLPGVHPRTAPDTALLSFKPSGREGIFGGRMRVRGTLYSDRGAVVVDTIIEISAQSIPGAPKLGASPVTLNLSNLTLCRAVDSLVTLRNDGCDTLFITEQLLNLPTDVTADALQLPIAVPPGGSVQVQVHAKPKAKGSTQGTLRFVFARSAFLDTLTVDLKTTVITTPPVLTATPDLLNLGAISVCRKLDTILTLRNDGCEPLTIDKLPYDLGDGIVIDPIDLPFTLGPDSVLVLHLRIKPTRTGPLNKQLNVGYSAESTVKNTLVRLQLSGIEPTNIIDAVPASLQLPTLTTCGTFDSTLTIRNIGCDTLTIDSLSLVNAGLGSTFSTLTLPLRLPPDSTLTIHVHTAPASEGNLSDRVRLFLTGNNSRHESLDLQVHATVDEGGGVLKISQRVLDFGQVSFCLDKELQLTLSNVGCDTMDITDARLNGDPDFSLTQGQPIGALAPDSMKSLSLRIKPTMKDLRQGSYALHIVQSNGETFDTIIDLRAFVISADAVPKMLTPTVTFDEGTFCETRESIIEIVNDGCDTMYLSQPTLSDSWYALDPSITYPIRVPPGEHVKLPARTIDDPTATALTYQGTTTFTSEPGGAMVTSTLSHAIIPANQVNFSLVVDKTSVGAGDLMQAKVVASSLSSAPGLTSVEYSLSGDPDLLTYADDKGPNQTTLLAETASGWTFRTIAPALQASNGAIADLTFQTALSKSSETRMALTALKMNDGDPAYARCIAYPLSVGEENVQYVYACGDGLIQSYLRGTALDLSIVSIRPVPFSDRVKIDVSRAASQAGDAPCVIEFVNAMGVVVQSDEAQLKHGANSLELSTHSLPSGIYAIRLRSGSSVLSRTVVKQ